MSYHHLLHIIMSRRRSSRGLFSDPRFTLSVATIFAVIFNFEASPTQLENSSSVKVVDPVKEFRKEQSNARSSVKSLGEKNDLSEDLIHGVDVLPDGNGDYGDKENEGVTAGKHFKWFIEDDGHDEAVSLQNDKLLDNQIEERINYQQNFLHPKIKTNTDMFKNLNECENTLSGELMSQIITICNFAQTAEGSTHSQSTDGNVKPTVRLSEKVECRDCENRIMNSLVRAGNVIELSSYCKKLSNCFVRDHEHSFHIAPSSLHDSELLLQKTYALNDQSNLLEQDGFDSKVNERLKRSIKEYNSPSQNSYYHEKLLHRHMSDSNKFNRFNSNHRVQLNDVIDIKRRSIRSEQENVNRASYPGLTNKDFQSKIIANMGDNPKYNPDIPYGISEKRDEERVRRGSTIDRLYLLARPRNMKENRNLRSKESVHSGEDNLNIMPSKQENKTTTLSRPLRSIFDLTDSVSNNKDLSERNQNLNNHASNDRVRLQENLHTRNKSKELVKSQSPSNEGAEMKLLPKLTIIDERTIDGTGSHINAVEHSTDFEETRQKNLESKEESKVHATPQDDIDSKHHKKYRQRTRHRYPHPRTNKWIRNAFIKSKLPDTGVEIVAQKKHKRKVPNMQLPTNRWPLSIKDIQPKGIKSNRHNRYRVPRDASNGVSEYSNQRGYQNGQSYSALPYDSDHFFQQDYTSNRFHPDANEYTALVSSISIPELSIPEIQKRPGSSANPRRIQKFLNEGSRRGPEARKLFLGKREMIDVSAGSGIDQKRSGWAKRRNLQRRPSRPSPRWAVFFLGKRRQFE